MKLDKKTIDCMASKGVMFSGYVDAPWSHDNIELEPDEIANFIEDRTKFSADHYGLTIEQFQKWMDWQGAPNTARSFQARRKQRLGRHQPLVAGYENFGRSRDPIAKIAMRASGQN